MPEEPASRDSWKANFLVNTERWLLKYPSQTHDFSPAQYSRLIALGSLSTDTSNTQIQSGVKEKRVIEVQMRSWVEPADLGPAGEVPAAPRALAGLPGDPGREG